MADQPNKPNRPVRPRQGAPGRKRRVVIEGSGQRPRDMRQARNRSDAPKAPPREIVPPTGPATVPSGVSVRDLSQALGVPAAQIIKIMMGLGQMVQITQSLSDEEVELIGAELSREITVKHAADEEELPEVFEDSDEDRGLRWSRSWATSTTARPPSSTRSASRQSSRPRRAGSRSTSAPTRSTSTAAR
jgi:hypothetical protein